MSATHPAITLEQLQLATRNHGQPLEALRHEITPVGLHYLLTHYDIPFVDEQAWRLEIGGLVQRPLTLSLEDLRGRPSVEHVVTMECAGNGRANVSPAVISQPWLHEAVGTAAWRGTPLRPLLDEAGVEEAAIEVVFTGLDRGVEGGEPQNFGRSLALRTACREEVLLAYEMNGWPLLPQHGFPLRLVVPGWYGMTNVKWLSRIEAVGTPFEGYQQSHAYRLRSTEDDAGVPLDRMLPRSLMVPPGIPEFLSRERVLRSGACVVEGRAWSGHGRIETVDVSTDGGASWQAATLGAEPASPWAWTWWSFPWDAQAGRYELCCRARDSAGNEQPAEAPWNVGGYANNALQRVTVHVTKT